MLAPGATAPSNVAGFNTDLQASAKDFDAATLASLKATFGDQITIQGDAVVWAQGK